MPRWQFQACCLHLCRNGKRQQKEERVCVSGSCVSRHHFCFPSSSCSPAELPSAQSPCSEHRGQAHELVPPGPMSLWYQHRADGCKLRVESVVCLCLEMTLIRWMRLMKARVSKSLRSFSSLCTSKCSHTDS